MQDLPGASGVAGSVEMFRGVVGGADDESDLRGHKAEVGPAVEAAAVAHEELPVVAIVERADQEVCGADGSEKDVSGAIVDE